MTTRLIITWLCNLVDIAATLYLFNLGYVEANPVMAWLLQWPWLFVLVKLWVMSAITLYLRARPATKYAVITSWVAVLLYGAIALYYFAFFAFLI